MDTPSTERAVHGAGALRHARPYRHYRRDLGIETNQDYEAAVTRLLSGEKGYVRPTRRCRIA